MSIAVTVNEAHTAVSTVENTAVLDTALEDVLVSTITIPAASIGIAPYIVVNEGPISGGGAYTLAGATSIGATAISVNIVPPELVAGKYVVIDPYTINAEVRRVASVAGTTINLASGSGAGGYGITTLQYAHSSGAAVYFVDSQSIPWDWYGAKPTTGSDPGTTVATNNTLGFNRLTQQLWSINAWLPIGIGSGYYWVNNELKPEHGQGLFGIHPDSSVIKAHSSFTSFDDTGEVSIIHPYRDGTACTFATAGASSRWFPRGFMVDGNNLANSNGMQYSPQQPDALADIRFNQCLGMYALGMRDVQYADLSRVQVNACAQPFYMWGCGYVRLYNTAVTQTSGTSIFKLVDVTDSSFYGGLLETMPPTGGRIVDVSGFSNRLHFDSFYTSGFQDGSGGTFFYFDTPDVNPEGKCTYLITNAGCQQNTPPVNFVHDVQRGITINSQTDTQRGLVMGRAKGSFYSFDLDGKVVTNGPIQYAEIADPAAPPANNGIPYFRDNGSGKTQYCVRFPTGAVQVIATEP